MTRAAVLICLLLATPACPESATTHRIDPAAVPRPYSRDADYDGIDSSSFYLEMSDGARIAVNLHLPASLEDQRKIPAILHQTRYWRSLKLKVPARWFAPDGHFVVGGTIKKYFVRRGYAWVDVDVRGTGASFGRWKHSYWEREVKDGDEVVDWIVRQPWSDGKLGAWGMSYAGGAAEFLLRNRHPSVKAIVPMYSPFDVYDDIGFPGGLYAEWYVGEWARLNELLDRNELPVRSLKARLAVSGVRPVDGKAGKRLLRQALEQRTDNGDVAEEAEQVVFRDDASPNISGIDDFSPHAFAREVVEDRVPIYSYSGWYDGAYQHAAIRRFLTYGHSDDKLILGPWDHGGHYNVSRFAQTKASFDHLGELLKFFDHHLLGMDSGIQGEPRIHYYTMGEEAWKTSDRWPPAESRMVSHYLSSSGRLVRGEGAVAEPGSDAYQVDFEIGTGKATRWSALVGPTDEAALYPDWASNIDGAVHYTTPPLRDDLEVTGHPLVALHLSSSATDGAFFVYLADVAPDGRVHYVTEGMLRALHRNSIAAAPPYRDAVPVRLYDRDSAEPVVPGELFELVFDLLPISYRFEKGSSIRISISGADSDYFRPVPDEPPMVEIHRGPDRPSRILLPVITSGKNNRG